MIYELLTNETKPCTKTQSTLHSKVSAEEVVVVVVVEKNKRRDKEQKEPEV